MDPATRAGEPLLRMRRNDGKTSHGNGVGGDEGPQTGEQTVSSRKPESKVLEQTSSLPPQTKQARHSERGNEVMLDASNLIRKTISGLSDSANRGFISAETASLLRSECPGWDLDVLHAEFEGWVAGSDDRTPANWQKAFIGWVRRHHAKHRHELRGSY